MSQPKDDKALAKAKAKAMDRFLRDYDDYCARAEELLRACPFEGDDSNQFILNLEIDDDE